MSLNIKVPWAVYEGGNAFIKFIRKTFGHAPFPFVSTDVYIVNSNHEILLLRRSDDGKWCPPAGAVDPRESPQEAALRELYEETGLVAEEADLHLFHVEGGEEGYHKYPNGDEALFTRIIFVIKRNIGGKVKLDDENTEASWFAYDDLPDDCLPSVYRTAQKLSARWHEISYWD